jgi:hypothetical protein
MGNGTPLRVIHRQSAVIQRRIQIKKCEIHITRLADFEAKRKRRQASYKAFCGNSWREMPNC